MELVDNTPVPARCFIGPGATSADRIGHLVAKATFVFDASGRTWLDTQRPVPIFGEDVLTELGVLPDDHLPRRSRTFEVILLGAAHARVAEQLERAFVALRVGVVERTLLVTGHRRWIRGLGHWRPGDPAPFSCMPLTWANAYGGRARVWLDELSSLDLDEPRNPDGRGFVPHADVISEIPRRIHTAPGFPRLEVATDLPTVEHPTQPIRQAGDAPEPSCWATLPQGSTLALQRASAQGRVLSPWDVAFDRAHPDWIIDVPPGAAPVELTGLSPSGRISFCLPQLRVVADFVAGRSRGTIELAPRMLVLLPEQHRFYLVYRKCFTHVLGGHGQERCLRVRLIDGWSHEAEV